MGITVLFIGLIVGPIIGYLCGIWGIEVHARDGAKARLQAGFTGWFISGIVGLIISAITVCNGFPNESSISFFGIHVYGIVLGAWFASLFGAIAGVVSARVLSDKA